MNSKLTKIVFILLLSIHYISFAQNVKTIENDKVINLMSPQEFDNTGEKIQLIDVRTPEEYKEGHIKDAKNINLYDDNFITKMSKLDKNKPVYVYCRSGHRSGISAKKLKEEGFTKVYDLKGGILNWQKKGLKIVK